MRGILEKSRDEILPSTFLDYRLYLKELYEYFKKSFSSYSYQRFSADLGFKTSTIMHQIVRGYRPLTTKNAEKIAAALGLVGKERKYFLALVAHANAKTSAKRQECFDEILAIKAGTLSHELDKDLLAYFSEWYHPVIRELVTSPSFQNDPEWIARRITPHIRAEQARASIELLLRLGFVQFSKDVGRLIQTKTRVTSGHRVKGVALVAYHQRMIELGREALTRIGSERRDISGVTVCVNQETVEKFKAMIHAFEVQLLDEAEKSGIGDQVYQMNIQLFPFTE